MITNKKLCRDYELIKRGLKQSIKHHNYDYSLRLIEVSAHLQYNYSFKETMYDNLLENSLKEISDALFSTIHIIPVENTVLFYDFFGYDNRGLTQQYIRALKHLRKRIVLVFENKTRHYKNKDILEELNQYENKAIHYLEGESRIEKCKSLFNIIEAEKPKQVLMHLIPWDTIAYLVFYKITGIIKYQINLTDHAFWLGVDIIDVNIEFRSYGLNISEQKRQIPAHKNRILPYYPIMSSEKFKGFDFETEGKKIIFSGSSFYKVLGKDLEFFETIHRLLKLDENLIFLLAGSGNSMAIKKFINEKKLTEKIHLIGDRDDLYEVIKRIDYFVATFPVTGGLTSLLAIKAKKPVFAYVDENSLYNDLKELLYKNPNFRNYASKDNLVESFSQNYLDIEKAVDGNIGIITEIEFAENLNLIFQNKNPFQFLEKREDISLSCQNFNKLMIESENTYNPSYYNIIDAYLTLWEKLKIFKEFRRTYYKKLFKEDKRLFLKTIYYLLRKKI